MGGGTSLAVSKLSQNPFKGNAGLIVRLLFTDPNKLWTWQEIAQELDLSQAWVNRVLGTLELQGIAQRAMKGPKSGTQLTQTAELLKKWVHQYQLSLNPKHLYLSLEKSPLNKLGAIAEQEKWSQYNKIFLFGGSPRWLICSLRRNPRFPLGKSLGVWRISTGSFR